MSGHRSNAFSANPLIPEKQDKPTWQKLLPRVTRVSSLSDDSCRCILPLSKGKVLLWSSERSLESDKSVIKWGLGWQSFESLGISLPPTEAVAAPEAARATGAVNPATPSSDNLTSDDLMYLGEFDSKPYFAVEIPSDSSSKIPEIGVFSAPGHALQEQWVRGNALTTQQSAPATGQNEQAPTKGQEQSTEKPSDTTQLAFVDMMTLLQAADPENLGQMADMAIAGQARAMAEWHKQARFCGTCGTLMAPSEVGTRRACTSTTCRSKAYPRLDPVVIMLVLDESGERTLLGRGPKFPPGMWSCLAGFMEPGESMEEAVRREVREEVGLEVSSVEHHSSQPWPVGFGNMLCQLMVGFQAKVSSLDVRVDTSELEDAKWYSKEEVRKGLDFARYKRDRQRACASIHSPGGTSGDMSRRPERKAGEGRKEESGSDFYLPGPNAIAHSLIRDWALATELKANSVRSQL